MLNVIVQICSTGMNRLYIKTVPDTVQPHNFILHLLHNI